MNNLFSITCIGESVEISFTESGHIDLYSVTQYFDNSFFEKIKNKNVLLKGRAPNELYSYVSFWCVKNGCNSLSIFEYNLQEIIEIFNVKNSVTNKIPVWCNIKDNGKDIFIQIKKSESVDERWSMEVIKNDSNCFKITAANRERIILTGRGGQLFYTVISVSAALSDFDNVYVDKPIEEKLIVISGNRTDNLKSKDKTGIMIGVLGDPNSGKSVFSRVFGCLIDIFTEKDSTWVYDCDAAALTSDWYIYGLQRANSSEDEEKIKQDRKNIKQKWSLELERKVANEMLNAKNNLSVVIADMPGGQHKVEENIHERIPGNGRVEMLKVCDYYIIIGRKDQPDVIREWEKALQVYGLDFRVIAEILSDKPIDFPAVIHSGFMPSGIFTAEIDGLDRKNNRSDVVECMKNDFAPFVKKLFSNHDNS